MKRRPFSHLEKRFLVGSALGALLLGGFGIKLMGASTTPPRPPLPRPNGFDLYVAAGNALTIPNPPVDEINDRTRRKPAEAAKNYTPARRAAWVKANSKSWDLMRQARAAQTLHPDLRANFTARLPYSQLRELARCQVIQAKHFKDRNRWDLALQSGLDSLEMSHDIERGAPIIGSLVAMAVGAVASREFEDVPSHLTAKEARNGVRRLEKILERAVSTADVLREEKWVILANVKKTAGWPSRPLFASIGPMMDKFIAQSEKPLALQTPPPAPTGFFNGYAAILHSVPKRYAFNAARREMLESGLLLRLALRAYRMENGAYPSQLLQLAPKYISKIPRDPFGRGEAMRFRTVGDSYLVWSIGPDGKNDNGAPIPIKAGKKRVVISDDSLGDAVIRP